MTEVEQLKGKIRRLLAWHLLATEWVRLSTDANEKEIHFVDEYLLAIQARRNTDESKYYAKQDGVDIDKWIKLIDATIAEKEAVW